MPGRRRPRPCACTLARVQDRLDALCNDSSTGAQLGKMEQTCAAWLSCAISAALRLPPDRRLWEDVREWPWCCWNE